MDPAGHLVHELLPPEDLNPLLQGVHDWRSNSSVPGGQRVHVEAPSLSETVPGKQGKQPLPVKEYVPRRHLWQALLPGKAKVPLGHSSQVESLAKLPASHGVQLPLAALETVPEGHGMQLGAPSSE